MRVETLGAGEPEIVIVAAIHGDEPCGVHAVETLLDDAPPVERPVKCIVANERALDRDKRFIDTDLNRAFPGDTETSDYEQQLAADLLAELRGCTTLALHATQSTPRPFALVGEIGSLAETVCPRLSIDALVEVDDCVGTALGGYVEAIEIECGQQGTEQACVNAERLVSEFLGVMGALPATTQQNRTLPVYRLQASIPKRPGAAYDVLATNFERVDAETPYATIDGTPQLADEPFYPVLMSAHGYERQFGYAAELTDTIEPVRATTDEWTASDGAEMPEVEQ